MSFINSFFDILNPPGTFLLSHHDFDSAIYNSQYKDFTRELVHCFADTQQAWQKNCNGQMGRKISGLIASGLFKHQSSCKTWRIVERDFHPGNYGFLMANMLTEIGKSTFEAQTLQLWIEDLELKNKTDDYYFAIDLVLAICGSTILNDVNKLEEILPVYV